MASIAKRANGRWLARYRDAAGKEHTRTVTRKIDGQRWLDEVTTAVVTGQYVDPRAGRVTVAGYAEQWRAAQVWRPKTAKRIDTDLRVHILPVLGDRPIASVRPSDVQGLVKGLSDRLAPSSVKVVYATVRTLFKAAVDDRVIPSSPCVRVRLPNVAPKSLMIPAVDVVHAVGTCLPDRWRAAVYVAAGLGLRPGEVFGLQVGDVDFLRRSVRVQRQLDDHGVLGPLKTAASYRTIPLSDVVAVELAEHIAATGAQGLLFAGRDGGPVKRNSFSKTWRSACSGTAGAEGLTLHDLRHVYASALIQAGESVKTVQKRLGHSSAAMTLDVYAHLWPDSDERSRAAIDAFLGPPADCVRTVGT